MPWLLQHNAQFGDASARLSSLGLELASGIWSEHLDGVTLDQIQTFWSELSRQERQNLLRFDKQTLLEQARKYLYCSRCNGLILENYSQIAMHETEEGAGLLYRNACGGGNWGWISQGMANYGRGHGVRETCALHTARLSCSTLTDFWSGLSDETRQSLFRMKEEDFVERLAYR